MRQAGILAQDVLSFAGRELNEGLLPIALDRMVRDKIIEAGAYPSPLGYHGFPFSCCISGKKDFYPGP
jgi:methionyl aminopeptidase